MSGFEKSYLGVLEKTFYSGRYKKDRTGVDCHSTFNADNILVGLEKLSGATGENLGYQIPVLTTKKVFLKGIIHELIWMISGSTNVYYLQRNGVHIWDDWVKDNSAFPAFKTFSAKGTLFESLLTEELDNAVRAAKENGESVKIRNGRYPDYIYFDALKNAAEKNTKLQGALGDLSKFGDLGPVYGSQWRNWKEVKSVPKGTEILDQPWETSRIVYEEEFCSSGTDGRKEPNVILETSIDQINRLEYDLVHNPFSRRHILTAWNVGKIDSMSLPPCHTLAQFYVREFNGVKYLSSKLYARSQDLFLGTPFNLVFYSMLTILLAEIHGFVPESYIHVFGDAHVYINHVNQVLEQLDREVLNLPVGVRLKRKVTSITEVTAEDIEITGWEEYLENCHPTISAPVAV